MSNSLSTVDNETALALIVALIGTLTSGTVAIVGQRAAREAAAREREFAREIAERDRSFTQRTAFRDDQVAVVERVLMMAADLMNQGYAITGRWSSGKAQAEYELAPDAGPGAMEPAKIVDTHHYHGTRMDDFHRRCRRIHLLAYRIGDGDLQRDLHAFTGRVENLRNCKSVQELTAGTAEAMTMLSGLLRTGGSYSQSLFTPDPERRDANPCGGCAVTAIGTAIADETPRFGGVSDGTGSRQNRQIQRFLTHRGRPSLDF